MLTMLCGVDPGVNTGLAVWDRSARAYNLVASCGIVSAMRHVLALHETVGVEVWFEDARLRQWYGDKGREALQGAGSIKRDCGIWEEFCAMHGIPHRAIKPAKGATKWDAERFKKMTGWPGRTNEHARDAALLVFQA